LVFVFISCLSTLGVFILQIFLLFERIHLWVFYLNLSFTRRFLRFFFGPWRSLFRQSLRRILLRPWRSLSALGVRSLFLPKGRNKERMPRADAFGLTRLAFPLYLFEVSAKPRQSRNLEEVFPPLGFAGPWRSLFIPPLTGGIPIRGSGFARTSKR
jgi:hypothetical protein